MRKGNAPIMDSAIAETGTSRKVAAAILIKPLRSVGLGVLLLLEPVVNILLGSLGVLGLLMTLFWKSVGPETFPAWGMFAISVGFLILLIAYHKLIQLLSA